LVGPEKTAIESSRANCPGEAELREKRLADGKHFGGCKSSFQDRKTEVA